MFNISNSVRLIGRLGQDPDIKTLENDKKVAHFSLATNDYYKNASGEKVQNTTWHHLVAWGPKASFAEQYLHKGREVSVEGKLIHRSYTNKDGLKKYITEVVLNEIRLFSEAPVLQES